MKAFIQSSEPVNGRMSIIEAGQRVFLSPQYAADSTGAVRFDDPHNMRILSLKSLTTGKSFKGKIIISKHGGWVIVDVDEPK